MGEVGKQVRGREEELGLVCKFYNLKNLKSFVQKNNYVCLSECTAMPPMARVLNGPKLLPGAISGSVALLQLGFVCMSVALVTTEGCAATLDMRGYLETCCDPRATLQIRSILMFMA